MAGEPHPNPSPKGEGSALEVSHKELNGFVEIRVIRGPHHKKLFHLLSLSII